MRAARLYYPLGKAPLPVCLEAWRGAHLLHHGCDSSSYHPVSRLSERPLTYQLLQREHQIALSPTHVASSNTRLVMCVLFIRDGFFNKFLPRAGRFIPTYGFFVFRARFES